MKGQLMGDLINAYEAELEANTKAEMAAEAAAWEALSKAEQDRIWEERLERQAARFADLMEYDPDLEDAEDDEDDSEDC